MSYQAVAWVYKHSPLKDAGPFSVHLAMAEVVNDEYDSQFWMSLEKLALKSRTSRATAKRTVDTLVEMGLLSVLTMRAGRSSLYRMEFPEDAEVVYNAKLNPARGDRASQNGSRVVSGDPARGDRAPRAPRATTTEETGTDEEIPRLPCPDCGWRAAGINFRGHIDTFGQTHQQRHSEALAG